MFAARKAMLGGRKKPPKIEGYAIGQNSYGNSLTVSKPAGTVAGDLLVFIGHSGYGTMPTWTAPTGWTKAVNSSGMCVAYLVAGASEGASYTFTLSPADQVTGAIYRISSAQWDAVGTVVTVSAGAAGAVTAASITAAGGVLIAAFATLNNSGSWTVPSGMATSIATSSYSVDMRTFTQDITTGATGTRASTCSSTGYDRVGVLISVKGI